MGQINLQLKSIPASIEQGRQEPSNTRATYSPLKARSAAIMRMTAPSEKTVSNRINGSFFASLPFEPEDARITGTTRSLDRRLLALNRPVTRVQTLEALTVRIVA